MEKYIQKLQISENLPIKRGTIVGFYGIVIKKMEGRKLHLSLKTRILFVQSSFSTSTVLTNDSLYAIVSQGLKGILRKFRFSLIIGVSYPFQFRTILS